MKPFLFSLAVAALLVPAQSAPTHQFDHFFPAWNSYLQGIIHNDCQSQFESYQTGRINVSAGESSLVTPLIECILNEFPEFRKSEMAASAVILGLLPMILQSLGSTTAETALVSLRRPFLAFLLAAGSPAVIMTKGSGFVEELGNIMEGSEDLSKGIQLALLHPAALPIFSVLEYMLAGLAVANVVDLAYRLGVNAIVIFSPETIFLIPLWAFLAVIIHLGGVITLLSRVKVVKSERDLYDLEPRCGGFPRWLIDEFVPYAFQPPRRLQYRPQNIWFLLLSWFLGLGILGHIVFGTLALSSLLFFSVVDSLVIIVRFAASSMACRIVVRIELAGMTAKLRGQELEGRREEQIELTQVHGTGK